MKRSAASQLVPPRGPRCPVEAGFADGAPSCSSERRAWHPASVVLCVPPPTPGPWGPPAGLACGPCPAAPSPASGLESAVPAPSDVQQHEYSYFLFKTNLEFSLSKGLLITKKCLRQELIDRQRGHF